MKRPGLGKLYSVSLNYKIIFGFLFSIIPMLAIVAITHDSARESAFTSCDRQIELISNAGAEHFDIFFQEASETFLEWTEEDVFGMAIEFKALDEMKQHLAILQRNNPDFHLLLITDQKGNVLEETRSFRPDAGTLSPLKDAMIKELRHIESTALRTVHLVYDHLTAPPGRSDSPSLLYAFRTADSAGKHNGFLLAYMDIAEIVEVASSIHHEMSRSGFSASRIAVIDNVSENILGYAGPQLAPGEAPFGPPLQTLLGRAVPGQLEAYSSDERKEQITLIPLTPGGAIPAAGPLGKGALGLSLIIAVDEEEIMAEVRRTLTTSAVIGAVGVLALIFIGYFAVRSVTGPISRLVNVLQRYAEGDSSVRAEITSRDEIGYFSSEFNSLLERINASATELKLSESRYRNFFEGLQGAVNSKNYQFRFSDDAREDDLASSLNTMLQTLETADMRAQEEDWLKTGLTRLSEKISGEHALEDLCRHAITFIADYTGSQVGTIFIRNSDDNSAEPVAYELIASYAYKSRKGLANRFRPGEGLVGQAALEKKTLHFTDIPTDYIRIESALGMSPPVNILVIPLVYEGVVEGVIELGASFLYTRRYLILAEQVGSLIAVAIHAAIANERLKSLLAQTKKQSDILQKQQEELQRANTELEEQTETLKQSEARLQVQQEELQASNEEMEEKNQMLEEQKRENEQANRELKQKQQELEEKARQLELATRYKSEFLSNMSHELRTPLNSILLLAKMLADNDEKNLTEDQIESAASIHRGGQTLLHLINDILDLSKIEAGKIELSIAAVRPETIIKDFKTEFNHIAKSKGLQFVTELGDDLPGSLVTDVYRLEQVIRNLLGNAFKFTESGTVGLRIARPAPGSRFLDDGLAPEKALAISVEDTGPGIPQDKLDLIFEAFKQVDGSISRRHGGTGLGLSISRELAKLIGGELQVQSTEGKGTTFTLYIPAELTKGGSRPEPASSFERPKQPVPAGGGPAETAMEQPAPVTPPDVSNPWAKRMLIIEDDPEFSSILANFFQKNGYETIIAPTGEIGVKYAIEQMPTAVVLDIGLPGIDGWTVLNELKNNPETRHIPVHIMSAYDEASQGLKKGAVGYLTKPVDIEGLRSALGRIEHVLENPVKELLIVEDDEDLRKNILKLMESRDIRATTAETGHQAMTMLRSNRFDCMILDLGLPDISGFTLLDEIEKDPLINRLPVIIFTGRDLSQEETERLESYSSSIVLKSALSMERLLDETALFMHRVEQKMPASQQKMIQELRDKDSTIRGKNVLLVDDDMRNAFALSNFLKGKGVVVNIADNGKKALELLETQKRPDIVLMDIMMPVMDGYETMKAIRKQPKFKDLPILALTAKAMGTDREECIRSGANDYLSKPIDTQKLLSMLRIWMY